MGTQHQPGQLFVKRKRAEEALRKLNEELEKGVWERTTKLEKKNLELSAVEPALRWPRTPNSGTEEEDKGVGMTIMSAQIRNQS